MKLDAATLKIVRRLEWEFHRRAFGDEMARVNFLGKAERRAYLARLRKRTEDRRLASKRRSSQSALAEIPHQIRLGR